MTMKSMSEFNLNPSITGREFWRQQGASLLVGLIFLVILTMFGLMALRVATVEERMSGNARDRSVAFQAAEAALRDAELDIKCLAFDGSTQVSSQTRAMGCISGAVGADALCTDGLCCNVSGLTCIEPATPVYANTTLSLAAANSVAYGTYTKTDKKTPTIAGVTNLPRYLIEPFVWDSKNYYRITARGYGLGTSTQVTLQEVYKE